MQEVEHDVGSLEQLQLQAGKHYLAGKVPLEDHFGKDQREVEKCRQHFASPLRIHVLQLEGNGYHMLWPPDHRPAVWAVSRTTELVDLYHSPGLLHVSTRLSSIPKMKWDSSLNTTFC